MTHALGKERRCRLHGLLPSEHCPHIEAMLQEVPGDFCEGEGDYPKDAVERLRLAYEEATEERDGYRSTLADLLAAVAGGNFDALVKAQVAARRVLKNGPAVRRVSTAEGSGNG